MNDSAAPSAPPVAMACQQALSSTSRVGQGQIAGIPLPLQGTFGGEGVSPTPRAGRPRSQDTLLAGFQDFQAPTFLARPDAFAPGRRQIEAGKSGFLLRVHDPGCASGFTPLIQSLNAFRWMRNVTFAVIRG